MASRSWNRVELIGNLTRDPEMRFTPQGSAVCTFSIATNRTFVTDGEKREEVDFHRIVSWNKLAELCNQLLKKGNRVFVSGRLQNRSWETPEGVQRQITEIVIEDMILLTSKPSSDSEYASSEAPADETYDVAPEAKPAAKPAPKEEPKKEAPEKEDVGDLDDLPF